MRKQLYLKFWLLAMLFSIVGASPTWAEDYSLTPNQSSTGSNATTYITTLTAFNYNGISWKMNQWNPKSLQIKTNEKSATGEFRFYNTSAFPGRITKVVITFSSLTKPDASKLMFLGGTSEVTATTGGTAGTWNSTDKTLTWTPGTSANYTYFAFYQNGKAASGSNYLATSNAIVVTYETTPSFTLTEASNNDTYGTVSVKDNVITASPAEGYRVSTSEPYTITSGESNVSSVAQEGNTFTVTATGNCTVQINFEAIPSHAVTITPPTGGTLTVKNGDEVVSSGSSVREGTTLTIIPEADSSHRFNNWKANNGAANTDVFTYTMSTGDVIFTATFDEVVKYAVNWNVNGNVTTEYYEENEDITFPTNVDNIEGKEFVGWCASTVSTTDTEPSFVTAATMGTSALTYYAVFATRNIGATTEITDELTRATTGVTSGITSYSSWSNKTATSSAVYAGNSAGGNDAIQLNSSTPKGLVSTTSGGKVKKVVIGWSASTTSGRTLDVYGKNSAYSAASDLYDSDKQGTKLGSIENGKSTELSITDDYEYIGLRSNSGAMYLEKVSITWSSKAPDTFTGYTTTVAPKFTLTFSNPAGGTIAVTDEDDNAVTTGDRFEEGTILIISATPNTGYTFSTWTATAGSFDSDDATQKETFYTTGAANATLSATFTLNTHTLSTTATNGSVAVTVNDEAWNGTDEIPYGATVSITATPNTNYLFSDWSSSDIDIDNTTTNPLVFTMPDKNVSVTATFANANTEYDITIASTIENGTVTTNVTKAKSGDEVTLTATPAAGYIFDSWNVTDAMSNTVTVTNNKFTMPASNVTVSVSFIRQYTITYYVAGEEQTVKRTGDEVLGLDDPEAIDGMPFAGWSVTNDLSNPSFADNTAPVTSDMTLYAAFTAHAVVNEYQKVTATSQVTDGEYLIVYEDGNRAFDGSLETLDAVENVITNLTINNGIIESSDKLNNGTFTYNATDKTLKSKSGYYIGQTSDANGLATSNETKYTNDITIKDNGDATIISGGTYLRYNSASNQARFRYYKSTSYSNQEAIQLYKKVSTPAIYTFGETVSVSVTSAGYATYCSDKALDFSHATGLKAYIVTSDGSTTDYTEVTDAPANTGLLLKAAANDYEAYVVGTSTTDVTDNKLVGVTSATGIYATTDGKTNFVLFNGTQGVGFYKVKSYNDGNPDFTVKANSAYLSVALVSNARESSFFGLPEDESETTGITMVQGERATTQGYYNLNGQRVSQPNRGLYIVNGKKIVIK